MDHVEGKHLTMTSGIPKHPHAHQHVHTPHAVLRLFRLMEETLKKQMCQLSGEERPESTRIHSLLENFKTDGFSVDHLSTVVAQLSSATGSWECSPRLGIFSDYFLNSFCIAK